MPSSRSPILLPALLLVFALAVPVAAQTDDITLTIDPPTIVAGEPFTATFEGPPGALVFWLWDFVPGQTTIPGIGTVDLAFSQFLVILPVGVIPENGVLEFPCLMPCVDLSAIGAFPVFTQALGKQVGQPGYLLSNPLDFLVLPGDCSLGPGDLVTFTQGGWGTSCSGNNPGCLRDANFASVFPEGLVVGDDPTAPGQDPAAYGLVLTSSMAVQDFLPNGGTAAALSGDEVDVMSSSAGVLAGQLVAATINVAFDDAGVFDGMKAKPAVKLGDLFYAENACVVQGLAGRCVRDVLDIANQAISGAVGPVIDLGGDLVTLSDLVTALTALNENFDDGDSDNGCLELP